MPLKMGKYQASPAGAERAARAIGLLVSVVALGGVGWWASSQQAPRVPASAGEWGALAGAVIAYSIATALRSERWYGLLRRDGAEARRADCYALTLVGFMANTALPARAGDAARVVLIAPRARTSVRTAIGTLVAERMLDVATLFTLFGILALLVLDDAAEVPAAAWAAGGAVVVLMVVTLFFAGRLADRGTGRIARTARFLGPMLSATRGLRGRWGARMLAMTLAIWLVEATVWLLSARAVGVEMAPQEAIYLIGLAATFALVPSGPGYAGTLDTAVVVGARSLGVSGGGALSYLLMLRFVLFIPVTLAGAVALVVRYGGPRGLRLARAKAQVVAQGSDVQPSTEPR